MLKLPEVTIWTIVWNEDRKWIGRAGQVLRYCRTVIEPARMVLFTHGRVADREYPFDVISIPQLNWQSYNIFVNRVVPFYIRTPFSMSVHEDGFPLDVSLWDPAFLEYDYIGAPWSDGVVGNGGFNIESRKLMDLKSVMPMTAEDFHTASDRLLCTTRRAELEARGVRFAPRSLALKFSTEQVGNESPSFGFHGRGPAADKYRQGWQMINAQPLRQHQGFTLQRNKVVQAPRVDVPANVTPPTADLGEYKAAMVYVYPLLGGKYRDWARRFVASYQRHPPDYPHDSIVVLNGGRVTAEAQQLFRPLMNLRFLTHDNSGYDIGAFQRAARTWPQYDIMAFFGTSSYLKGRGWMRRVVESSRKHGLGLYGVMGNRGDGPVMPHIRTTAFWIKPELLNRYPQQVNHPQNRYEFEHGRTCLAEWLRKQGLPRLVVTWDNEYEWKDWDSFPNGFHRGDQSALLAGDRLTEPPYYATA